MAENDIKVVKHPGPVRQYDTEDLDNSDESATLKVGEPVKRTDGSADYLELLETDEPVIAEDEFVGIVAREGTAASGSDGNVLVTTILPVQTVLRCDAHTATNIDTSAELLALKHNNVTFDLTSSTFTINENETDDPNVHGLKIIDGDINKGTLDVIVHANCCEAGKIIGQTMD